MEAAMNELYLIVNKKKTKCDEHVIRKKLYFLFILQ